MVVNFSYPALSFILEWEITEVNSWWLAFHIQHSVSYLRDLHFLCLHYFCPAYDSVTVMD